MTVAIGPSAVLNDQIGDALRSMCIEERDGIDAEYVEGGGSYYPVVTDLLPSADDVMDAFIRVLIPMAQGRTGRAADRPTYIVWRTRPRVVQKSDGYLAEASFFFTPSNIIANAMTRPETP